MKNTGLLERNRKSWKERKETTTSGPMVLAKITIEKDVGNANGS